MSIHSGKKHNTTTAFGEKLYNLIIENNYTWALEIGTSTGRSTIWIARAMIKTGGKVITIEIDEDRYNEALKNFREAGVSEYIDARLANAHDLVPKLDGPFALCIQRCRQGLVQELLSCG